MNETLSMDITLDHSKLTGHVRVIASKSFAHRIMIGAALAKVSCGEDTKIVIEEFSEDMKATQRVIEGLFRGDEVLDCGESGTTLRFILPIIGALGLRKETMLIGQGRLMERPMGPLIEAMEPHGVEVVYEDGHILCRGKLNAGNYSIAANVSSQYISGLLFALPLLKENSVLQLEGQVESRPYIDITLEVLRAFGIQIDEDHISNCFFIKGGQTFRSPGLIQVEGDWSNAAFWLAAGAIGGSPVTVSGLNLNSKQGDKTICRLLRQFGAVVVESEDGVTCRGNGLHSTNIDAKDIPDLVPILSVVGAAALGETKIYHAARLRIKESDRLETTAAMLRSIGAEVEEGEDYLLIRGNRSLLSGGIVDGANDHRIVMSGAIAALICRNPVTITGAEAVNKSYPNFFEEREKICQVHGERI